MVAYAYLRVSTDHQDLDNQRHGILEYANTHAIGHLKFVEDKTSGRRTWRSRMVGELILETKECRRYRYLCRNQSHGSFYSSSIRNTRMLRTARD